MLEQQKMNKLTAEILKVNQFAQGLYFKKNNDKVVNFLISLDLLVKWSKGQRGAHALADQTANIRKQSRQRQVDYERA